MVVLPAPATAKAPAERFTGDVWVDGITNGTGPGTAALAAVRFSPGARTAWHAHANDQILHVTGVRGLVCSVTGGLSACGPGTRCTPRPAPGTGTAQHRIRSCHTSHSRSRGGAVG